MYDGEEGREYTLLVKEGPDGYNWIKTRFLLMRDDNSQPYRAIGVSERMINVEAEMRCLKQEQQFAGLVREALWGSVQANLSKNRLEKVELPPAILPEGGFSSYDELCDCFRAQTAEAGGLTRGRLLDAYRNGQRHLSGPYQLVREGGPRLTALGNLIRHPLSGDLYAFIYLLHSTARPQQANGLSAPAELDPHNATR